MNGRTEFILDSSALLALIFGETGDTLVRSMLSRAAIGAVNYAEVIYKLIQKGAEPQEACELIDALRLPVIAFDAALAAEGADLASKAGAHGLSLGDRACLTLARHYGVPAITADQVWKTAGFPVKVRLIR